MDRRYYLGVVASALLAGCGGTESNGAPESATTSTAAQDASPNSVGESVTYGGLEMSVAQTQTTAEVTTTDWNNRGEEQEVVTAPEGATFALAWVRVENVDDAERLFPLRDGEITLRNGEDAAGDRFLQRPILAGDGEMYRNELIREEAADGAFPGTVVEGWAIFEVAENFDTATIAIEYPGEAADERTFEWEFEG